MIEKIKYKKKLYALIVRGKYRNKRGINFFTPKEATQQFGYMKHKKGYIIQPHQHRKRLTRIMTTTEVILLLKGTKVWSEIETTFDSLELLVNKKRKGG